MFKNMKIGRKIFIFLLTIVLVVQIALIAVLFYAAKYGFNYFIDGFTEFGDAIQTTNSEYSQATTLEYLNVIDEKEAYALGYRLKNAEQTLESIKSHTENSYSSIVTAADDIDMSLVSEWIEADENVFIVAPEGITETEMSKIQLETKLCGFLYNDFSDFEANDEISNVTITFSDGLSMYYSETPSDELNKDYTQEEWYQKAYDVEDFYWLKAYDNGTGSQCLTCISNFYYGEENDENILGSIKMDLDMEEFYESMNSCKIYDDDILCIIQDDGQFVVDPNYYLDFTLSEDELNEISDTVLNEIIEDDTILSIELDDKSYTFVTARLMDDLDWNFCMGINGEHIDELSNQLNDMVNDKIEETEVTTLYTISIFLVIMLLVTILLLVLAVIFSLVISKAIANPIKNLTAMSEKIAAGDTSLRVPVKSKDEVGQLGSMMNYMLDQIEKNEKEKSEILAEQERIGAELSIAAKIQDELLPSEDYEDENVQISAFMQPAKEVGGDFYNYFYLDDTHIAIFVADVSGKGVPASMFMSMGNALLRATTLLNADLSKVFYDVNNLLCENNKEGQFITAFAGILDLETGQMDFVNAGHEQPLIRKPDGSIEVLEVKSNFILAAVENFEYEFETIFLEPGSVFFQYTDGLPEANDKDGNLYGMDRLEKSFTRHKDLLGRDLIGGIIDDMKEYMGDTPPFDDTTMLALYYKKTEKNERTITLDATVENIEVATNFINKILEEMKAKADDISIIDVAVDEIFGNIANYGYPDKCGQVEVKCLLKEDPLSITISFADSGVQFNPLSKEDPDINQDFTERQIGGLGIFIVKEKMDAMDYKYEDGKNIMTLTKKL